MQDGIVEKRLRLYVIDAVSVARDNGMGTRINTVMQTCFFALSGVLPRDEAIEHIKHAIEKTYAKRGPEVVERNFAAVDDTLRAPARGGRARRRVTATRRRPSPVAAEAPDFVARVSAVMLAGHGDLLPVSAFPVDGTWPTATSQWEKRNIALDDPGVGRGPLHPVQQVRASSARTRPSAPRSTRPAQPGERAGDLQVDRVQDARVRPGHGLHHAGGAGGLHRLLAVRAGVPGEGQGQPAPQGARHDAAGAAAGTRNGRTTRSSWRCRKPIERAVKLDLKGTQFLQPLFEYSGACAGCGETPYIKLVTQLFGDRAIIANATGCSSIYGGNLPTTPYTTNRDGRGPAWANSLFEDNAEFGLGMRLSVDQHVRRGASARGSASRRSWATRSPTGCCRPPQRDEAGIAAQRDAGGGAPPAAGGPDSA